MSQTVSLHHIDTSNRHKYVPLVSSSSEISTSTQLRGEYFEFPLFIWTFFFFSDLFPETIYNFKVFSENKLGGGEYSNNISVKTDGKFVLWT